MPRYDGFYAIGKIREFDPDSKIVAITGGNLTVEEYVLLDSLKANAVLYKPFSTKNMIQIVSHVFSNK